MTLDDAQNEIIVLKKLVRKLALRLDILELTNWQKLKNLITHLISIIKR